MQALFHSRFAEKLMWHLRRIYLQNRRANHRQLALVHPAKSVMLTSCRERNSLKRVIHLSKIVTCVFRKLPKTPVFRGLEA